MSASTASFGGSQPLARNTDQSLHSPSAGSNDRSWRALFLGAFAFFYLNDLLYLVHSPPWFFYGADYLFKGSIVALLVVRVRRGYVQRSAFLSGDSGVAGIILWSVILCFSGIAIDQVGWRFFGSVLPSPGWAISYPVIRNDVFRAIDLYFGLVLVAIAEEYVFRYEIARLLQSRYGTLAAVVAGSVLFGLAHWSLGFHAIATTALWAVLPLVCYFATGTTLPAMVAHLVTDFVSFSGILNGLFQ